MLTLWFFFDRLTPTFCSSIDRSNLSTTLRSCEQSVHVHLSITYTLGWDSKKCPYVNVI